MMMQRELFGSGDKSGGQRMQAKDVRLVRVAFENSGDRLYDYGVPGELADTLMLGMRVRARFGRGNQSKVGFCVSFPPESDVVKVKMIDERVDASPLLSEELLELARWMSSYYCCPLGAVLSAMVPMAVKQQVGVTMRTYVRLTEQTHRQEDPASLVRGPKGKQVLRYLLEQGKGAEQEFLLDDIRKVVSCGRASFTLLEKAGWIELLQHPQLGDPSMPVSLEESGERFELNVHQQQAFDRLKDLLEKQQFCAAVLHGVTGSGKTEVYMQCIDHVVSSGRQALVLVPEIAMTPQTVGRFLGRFKQIAVLHSGMSSRERHRHWRWIYDGGADVVVGARSAVFAPLSRLGLIVVDEEHEPSYKQEVVPRYHGRDAAIKRAQLNGVPILLGSATPSLETYQNCKSKSHYHLIELPERVMNLPLPQVRIVDMADEQRQGKGGMLLSRLLEHRLDDCLKRKRQAILLLNRRGHSHFVYCPSCKYTLTCPNCDVSLTYHRPRRQFEQTDHSWIMCHYCLYRGELSRNCPVCSKKMILIGPGTQRAEVELSRRFPDAQIRRVDSDSIKPGQIGPLLKSFGQGEIDIMLGTQMVGKGLDFPNVDLVGVLNADTSLSVPDFRSSERTFQLIAQVAGRCGRAGATGEVIVQTYQVDEPVIRLACRHDYQGFSKRELELRKRCEMPPFGRLARVILRDVQLEKVEQSGQMLRSRLELEPMVQSGAIRIVGPMPAGIARLENYHRWQLMLRSREASALQDVLYRIRETIFVDLRCQAVVDVDPMNLM